MTLITCALNVQRPYKSEDLNDRKRPLRSQLARTHWGREFMPPCLKTDKMAELSPEEFKKSLFTTFRSRGVLEALKVSLNVTIQCKFEFYNTAQRSSGYVWYEWRVKVWSSSSLLTIIIFEKNALISGKKKPRIYCELKPLLVNIWTCNRVARFLEKLFWSLC